MLSARRLSMSGFGRTARLVAAFMLAIACAHADDILAPGDFDGDGLVDATDYQEFFLRHDGPDLVPVLPGWQILDWDQDDDVDLRDFAVVQNGFTSEFVRFTDPGGGGFSTLDVNDVGNQIVRFRATDHSIVWAATGVAYQSGSWPVNGNLLGGGFFQVRFGTSGGQRRAYFTETFAATICNIEVFDSNLYIFATNVTVPNP